MPTSHTKALSIAQTIDILEALFVEIRKEMPGYKEPLMIVPEAEDLDLLSEFIAGVNFEVKAAALEQVQLIALDANGLKEWFAKFKDIVSVAVIWAGIRRYCDASRCSIKVKANEEEINIGAATPEEAERLFHCAARFIIYRLGASPPAEKEEANNARLDNRP